MHHSIAEQKPGWCEGDDLYVAHTIFCAYLVAIGVCPAPVVFALPRPACGLGELRLEYASQQGYQNKPGALPAASI